MNTWLHAKQELLIANGTLTILANLLYDVVLVGWVAFAGLFSLEILLPTFVTVRLSLVKFSFVLLVLTTLLAWLGRLLGRTQTNVTEPPLPRPLFIFFLVAGLGVITLAHYRFPWWSIPIIVGGYCLIVWLLYRVSKKDS